MSRATKVLIIGDTSTFGQVIHAMLVSTLRGTDSVRDTTYDDCRGMLTPRVVRETTLFVVELWRNYATGLRAEGIAVAEQLMRLGVMPLIVSPLSLGKEIGALCYWDLGSNDSLSERCATILSGRTNGLTRGAESIASLKQLLNDYMAKPVGHDDAR